MIIAIVGSREWGEKTEIVRRAVFDYVAHLPHDAIIISGGARGVDSFAKQAARLYGLAYEEYPADWKRFGRSAGMIRNQQIVNGADKIVAFTNGSPGTADTIRKARLAQRPVEVYQP